MVNDNSKLRGDLEQLELELQTHLQSHKQQMLASESTINTLLHQKAADEKAITGFVSTVQELRSERVRADSRILSLSRDLEESSRELAGAVAKSDRMVGVYCMQ